MTRKGDLLFARSQSLKSPQLQQRDTLVCDVRRQ